ncbi:MAG: class I SAM-dependent methyltransferase [Candidatus Micrarchaeia archaeon]
MFKNLAFKAPSHVTAWERDYFKRGAAWRGTTNFDLNLPPQSKVLEIGCGNGKNVSALARKGFELHAIDSSKSALKLCSDLLKRVEGKATLKLMDARRLEYADEFFDAVFCFHVLGHLLEGERRQAASEAVRVLRKGGTLFFRDFAEGDLRQGKGVKVEERTWRKGNGIITHYFSLQEARNLFPELKQEELRVEEWRVYYHARPWLRREIHARFVK